MHKSNIFSELILHYKSPRSGEVHHTFILTPFAFACRSKFPCPSSRTTSIINSSKSCIFVLACKPLHTHVQSQRSLGCCPDHSMNFVVTWHTSIIHAQAIVDPHHNHPLYVFSKIGIASFRHAYTLFEITSITKPIHCLSKSGVNATR